MNSKIKLLIPLTLLSSTLFSCGSKVKSTDDLSINGSLDVYINYQGTAGISLINNTWHDPIGGITYTSGNLLPTWKEVAKNIGDGITIRDASRYTNETNSGTYDQLFINNFKSDTNSNQNIDILFNDLDIINNMGHQNLAIDLNQYLDYMPNLKKYLKSDNTLTKYITKGGSIFGISYMKSLNNVSNTFIMDTEMVLKIFNDSLTFDSSVQGVGASENGLQYNVDNHYTSFIDASNNANGYNLKTEDLTVSISKNGKLITKKLGQTKNIIEAQNELLEKGTTGKELRDQFVEYMNAVYGSLVSDGTYTSLADAFISESSCYTVDELVALMRVIKANPKLITGDETKEVELIIPTSVTSSGVDSITKFLQLFGIEGMDSNSDMLYYDKDGYLNDASTTKQTYDGLVILNQLYEEGLILEDFNSSENSDTSNYYINTYFSKTAKEYSYGFMMYGDATTLTLANDSYNGIGTNHTDLSVQGIRSVLPPLTYVENSNWSANDSNLTDFTNKTLTRFYSSCEGYTNLAICIPSNCDNLGTALALIDYLFTEDGAKLLSYGPSYYYDNYEELSFNKKLIDEKNKTILSMDNFMMRYIGCQLPIARDPSYEESYKYLKTNYYAKVGTDNVNNAIKSGVVETIQYNREDANTKSGYSNNSSVEPSTTTISSTNQNKYDSITSFWQLNKCSEYEYGWVYIVKNGIPSKDTNIGTTSKTVKGYTYNDVLNEFSVKNSVYLYSMATQISKSVVPNYI